MHVLSGSRGLVRQHARTCVRGNGSRSTRCRAAAPQQEQRSSLIPETLQELAADADLQATLAAVAAKGQQQLTREEAKARKRSLQGLGLPSFQQKLQGSGFEPLRRQQCTTLQLNIGLYCNQACSHCHVESSPARTEMMQAATAQRCLQLLAGSKEVACLDLTGGAPELNDQFRPLVRQARSLSASLDIIDRCNLTVLCEPGQQDLPQFLAEHRVRVVASLPCYGQDNVDKQRGRGVFERSIEGLRMLNAVGYGQPGSGLVLDLVYNPGGAFLAPSQAKLQPAYKQELAETYGIHFNSLLCLNNMPIKRFADHLLRSGTLSEYMALLVANFNASAVPALMCHQTLSVAWDGRIYDCDFNQQLDMPILGAKTAQTPAPKPHQGVAREAGLTVWDVGSLDEVAGALVRTASHCYGCTAGAGSSCTGST
ncbi:Fe-S oxidoreductase, partial [Scenedesmus sp. NREL 46B-D3]